MFRASAFPIMHILRPRLLDTRVGGDWSATMLRHGIPSLQFRLLNRAQGRCLVASTRIPCVVPVTKFLIARATPC